jgi:hypothetical protein
VVWLQHTLQDSELQRSGPVDGSGSRNRSAARDQLARTLCAQVADPTDMSSQYNYVACIDATEVKAGGSLQALVKKQSAARFARAQ